MDVKCRQSVPLILDRDRSDNQIPELDTESSSISVARACVQSKDSREGYKEREQLPPHAVLLITGTLIFAESTTLLSVGLQ